MPELTLIRSGNLVGIRFRDEAAVTVAIENLETEGWQWLGNTLWLDARHAYDVVDYLEQVGLRVY